MPVEKSCRVSTHILFALRQFVLPSVPESDLVVANMRKSAVDERKKLLFACGHVNHTLATATYLVESMRDNSQVCRLRQNLPNPLL